MEKTLLIHCQAEETQVALLEDGRLAEYLIERPVQSMIRNIYKGRVVNVLPGMEAAFVDIGLDKNAFLHVEDVYPSKGIDKLAEESVPIQELVRVGDEVLVQISKEAVGNKGPRITTNITLPGRYLVYLPFGAHVGVSRKIEENEERERLKKLGQANISPPEGLIMRTQCAGLSEEEIVQELSQLRHIWEEIERKAEETQAPQLVYQELDMLSRVVRDHLTEEIHACIIDDEKQYRCLQEKLKSYPSLRERIVLYSGEKPLFEHYPIQRDLERALKRKVWLKSGGYIVIEQTEALTVVDVNTGKFIGDENLEKTVLKTNIEAAREIALQLRLRDIGGIIIVDFIDMSLPESKEAVLLALEEALKRDRTRTNLVGLTPLGLVEITRKKGRQSLLEVLSRPCPTCAGRGYIVP